MNTQLESLRTAVQIAGGQLALANQLGIKQGHVWSWLNTGRQRASGRYVLAIEAATGVSRHDLRPDIFGPHPQREPTHEVAA